MSLRANVLANGAGQLYVGLVGILTVPSFVRYLGAEAYGLVGFYAMLQAWFQLLDLGLSPTMARETARFSGGAIDAQTLRGLLRTLEGVFAGVAIVGALGVFAGANTIATGWLKVQHLSVSEVRDSIALMGGIAALRWMCSLYRGAINGFERLVWLNGFNVAVATFRFVLVIPVLIYVDASPVVFFQYQVAIALLEIACLAVRAHQLLPTAPDSAQPVERWTSLRRVVGFSLSIAFTGSVWIVVTQTDKLVLSKLLPLSEYAYFTLAVLVSSGVLLVGSPFSGALLPRLTKLTAEGDEAGVIRLYRNATEAILVVAVPLAFVLAFFAEQVLWAWTGDAELARRAAPVLSLYAGGNGFLTAAAFPYYIQYAKGALRLHLYGSIGFVVVLIPSLLVLTRAWGATGAGMAWLAANAAYFFVWVSYTHRALLPGFHRLWIQRDIAPIALGSAIVAGVCKNLVRMPADRLGTIAVLSGVSMMGLAVAVACAPDVRGYCLRAISRRT